MHRYACICRIVASFSQREVPSEVGACQALAFQDILYVNLQPFQAVCDSVCLPDLVSIVSRAIRCLNAPFKISQSSVLVNLVTHLVCALQAQQEPLHCLARHNSITSSLHPHDIVNVHTSPKASVLLISTPPSPSCLPVVHNRSRTKPRAPRSLLVQVLECQRSHPGAR